MNGGGNMKAVGRAASWVWLMLSSLGGLWLHVSLSMLVHPYLWEEHWDILWECASGLISLEIEQ